MTESQNFGQQYLQSLLRANPSSPEELLEAKQKIELYFRSREKSHAPKEQGKDSPHHQPDKALAARAERRPLARRKQKQLAPALSPQWKYRFKLTLTWFILIFVALLSACAKACGFFWILPVALCLLGLILWCRMRDGLYDFLGISDPDLRSLALAGLIPDNKVYPQAGWSRKCGTSSVPQFKEKWDKLDTNIQNILLSDNLKSACGPAEECLSIINYFNGIKHKQTGQIENSEKLESTDIDPINTLITRLIEEHEWHYADKLSQHFLALRNPDAKDFAK